MTQIPVAGSFRREEALHIYALLVATPARNYREDDELFQDAITYAQTFDEMIGFLEEQSPPPSAHPITSVKEYLCRYYSNDKDLLVETSSGERHLLCSFESGTAAAQEAEYLNKRYGGDYLGS